MGVADNFIGIPIYDSKGNVIEYLDMPIDIDSLRARLPRLGGVDSNELVKDYKRDVY